MTRRFLLLSTLTLACNGGDLVLPQEDGLAEPGAATRLVKVAGDRQAGQSGTELTSPLVVRLLNDDGQFITGQAVTWLVTGGGGSIAVVTAETDLDGRSSARWTLGPGSGEQTASAVVSGVGIAEFTATVASSSQPERLIFQVQPNRAERGERLGPAVQVAIVDERGSVVRSVRGQVTLELVGGDSKARLQGDTSRDLVNGVAIFSDLRISREGGDYRLRAFLRDFTSIESQTFDIIDD